MTKEGQTNDMSSKVTGKNKENGNNRNVNFIFPPGTEFPSDDSSTNNSIKKDIKNIIETFGNNTKQDFVDLNSNDDTISYDSSLHSEVQNNHNKTQKINADKRPMDPPKQVTHKTKEKKEDALCSTCEQDDSTLTEYSDFHPNKDYCVKKNRQLSPNICKFCQLQSCPASDIKRNFKPLCHCDRHIIYSNTNKTERPITELSHMYAPNPELLYSDPIYKQHEHCGSTAVKCLNSRSWNKFRYHNSHEYLKPWNHQKNSKLHRKYSHLKQQPSGIIGNFVQNVGQWYTNLKHTGEGDREELCCHLHPERQLSAESLNLLYKAKIEKAAEHSDPQRIVFNKVTGIPKPHLQSSFVNNPFCQYIKCSGDANIHNKEISNNLPDMESKPPIGVPDGIGDAYNRSCPIHPERIDVYYFDHGNAGYYRTTDRPPPLYTELLVERTDDYATKFWAEIFGACHIMVAFITTFILQFLRFILYSMVRPLLVGVVQLCSDYFFKPLLTIAFNGFVQPIFILLYNIATSFRDLCEPIAKAFGFFIYEIAQLMRAIRIVDINTTNKNGPFCLPHQPA